MSSGIRKSKWEQAKVLSPNTPWSIKLNCVYSRLRKQWFLIPRVCFSILIGHVLPCKIFATPCHCETWSVPSHRVTNLWRRTSAKSTNQSLESRRLGPRPRRVEAMPPGNFIFRLIRYLSANRCGIGLIIAKASGTVIDKRKAIT